jgi:integral membrane sensor domain MASE1
MELALETSSKRRTVLLAVLVGVAFYFGAKVGHALSTPPDDIATFWPPNAIILAALLLTDRRRWWIWFVAMLPAYIITAVQTERPATTTIIYYTANCTEILVAALVLNFTIGDRLNLSRLRDMAMFCFGPC